jgi:hypothetical protein
MHFEFDDVAPGHDPLVKERTILTFHQLVTTIHLSVTQLETYESPAGANRPLSRNRR